ncbi:hypothetical protein BS17DRAFT_357932 [Gyrodon lividus]|nr:hypothetical protein BS17DRAFT_357932 [Gyrodon lividus]
MLSQDHHSRMAPCRPVGAASPTSSAMQSYDDNGRTNPLSGLGFSDERSEVKLPLPAQWNQKVHSSHTILQQLPVPGTKTWEPE